VEVKSSGKHSRLLPFDNNYVCKKFKIHYLLGIVQYYVGIGQYCLVSIKLNIFVKCSKILLTTVGIARYHMVLQRLKKAF
jgi:hypothetical protein